MTDPTPEDGRLSIVPTTLTDAHEFVRQHHRHHRPSRGGLFAVAVASGMKVVGVAVVGRPVARMLQDGWTVEITRLCTTGEHNACSMLYRAAWRGAKALGWRRLVTYTLPEEGGASLRGAGFREIGRAGGGSWSVPSRPRVDRHPTQEKIRWEVQA